MLPGTYEVRSLETSVTATVPLAGRAKGRLVRERIVGFITAYRDEHGWSPTLREVAAAVGLRQANSVKQHLDALAAAGRVAYDPFVARSLRVVER